MPWDLIISLGGGAVGYLVKHFLGERKWNQVEKVATAIVKAPSGTTDPREALIEAMIQVNLDRIAAGAEQVRDTLSKVK